MKRIITALLAAAALVLGLSAAPATATLDANGRAVPEQPAFYWDPCTDAYLPGDLHAARPADSADLIYREQDAVDAPQWAKDQYPGYTGSWWRVWASTTGSYKFGTLPSGWAVDTFYHPVGGWWTAPARYIPTTDPGC